jgi:hypothetical protein
LSQPQTQPLYLTKRQLCDRWNRSLKFIERLLESDEQFPRPLRLGPTPNAWLMFKRDEIENYERLCAGRSAAAPKPRRRGGSARP